jgi:hypothetical protein
VNLPILDLGMLIKNLLSSPLICLQLALFSLGMKKTIMVNCRKVNYEKERERFTMKRKRRFDLKQKVNPE